MDTRINHLRRPSDIYSDLKDLIVNYRFRLGEHLHLSKLSERLGVSVTPVREALIRLSAESLVTFLPGRGFFPNQPNAVEQLMLHDLAFPLLNVCLESRKEAVSLGGAIFPRRALLEEQLGDSDTRRCAMIAADHLEHVYVQVASLSGNAEFARVLKNFGDRTHFIRVIELEQHETCRRNCEDILLRSLQGNDARCAIDAIQQQFDSTRNRIDELVKEALVRVSR